MKDETKHITEQRDVDFIWNLDTGTALSSSESTTLIVFQQNEKGFAPFIAGMGLIGESEPHCKIYSKLLEVGAYNTAPEPTFPEWRLHEMRNDIGRRYFILRISNIHPLPTSDSGDHTWLYTYPILRDIILELNKSGVDEMIYLTTNQMQASLGYEFQTYAALEPHEIAVYDYCLEEDEAMTTHGRVIEKDIILPMPSWSLPALFLSFCTAEIKGCWVVIGFNSRNNFIDKDTAKELLRYCENTHGITNYSQDRMDKLVSLLMELEELTDAPTLDRLMNSDGMGEWSNEWV